MKQENSSKLNDTFNFTILNGGHSNWNLGFWAIVVTSANVGKLNIFG
jgi:hypothetical protein